MFKSNHFKLSIYSIIFALTLSCGKSLTNRLDPLQAECGVTSKEAVSENLWIFKIFSEGKVILSKDLELFRISLDGSRSSEDLGATDQGCVTLDNHRIKDTILVNLPSTNQPRGIRYDVPNEHPLGSPDRIIPLVLQQYGNQPFDLWSQCGELGTQNNASKSAIIFKIINKTEFDIPASKYLVTRTSGKDTSPIEVSQVGCFLVDFSFSGTINVTDSHSLTFVELTLTPDLMPSSLYPIYLRPAPTDEERCLKRGIQWKWTEDSCKLKNSQDFCKYDRQHIQLKPTFDYLFEA